MTTHSKVPIKMIEDDTEILIKAVRNGTCDIAFIQEDPFHPVEDLEKLHISSDTLDAVLPIHHPLAKRESIDLRQLAKSQFAIGIEDKIPGSIFLEACRRAGFEPKISRNGLVGPALFTWIGSENSNCVGLEWHIPAQRHKNDRTTVVPIDPPVRAYTTIIYRSNRLSETGQHLINHFLAGSTLKEGLR